MTGSNPGPYDPRRHHRRSIRLRGYDYSQAGAYFVTLCVQDRECLLGRVAGGVMELNDFGRVVAESWEWLAAQYPHVELDEWVIMPNHMHGIVVIVDDDAGGRGGSRTAPTRTTPTGHAPTGNAPMRDAPKQKPLGRLIGAFKTVSSKRINELRGTPGRMVWQRNYWEHIIRDAGALRRIQAYIAGNPARWETDQLYPSRSRPGKP